MLAQIANSFRTLAKCQNAVWRFRISSTEHRGWGLAIFMRPNPLVTHKDLILAGSRPAYDSSITEQISNIKSNM